MSELDKSRINNNSEIDFYEHWIEKHDIYEVYPDWEYKRILEKTRITEEKKDQKVLDVGCGSGAFTIRLAQMGFQTVGVDISPRMIEVAKKLTLERERERERLKNVEYYVSDLLNLPFDVNSFDIIFAGAALHHLPDDLDKCAVEFYRILKPNGKVFMFEPYALNLNSFLWYRVFSYHLTKDERALIPNRVKKIFTEKGFYDFHWESLGYVEHKTQPTILWKTLRFISKYFLPNEFFVAFCKKK